MRNDRFRCVDRLPFINFPHAYAITIAGRCTRAKPRETSWNPVTSLVSLDDEFSCHGVSNVERSWYTKLAAQPTSIAINSCRRWYRIRAPGELDYKLVSWDEVSRESWSINWKTLRFRLIFFSQRESLLVEDWFNETRMWVDQFYLKCTLSFCSDDDIFRFIQWIFFVLSFPQRNLIVVCDLNSVCSYISCKSLVSFYKIYII